MPVKSYYDATVFTFLQEDTERILGILAAKHHHSLEEQQRWAWLQQISILKASLAKRPEGRIFLEFYIPRMGKRADAILIEGSIVFVIEFKAGATEHTSAAFDQVEDYALDLKNFHEGSHAVAIVPVLVSTNAESQPIPEITFAEDLVASPVATNGTDLGTLIEAICCARVLPTINIDEWMAQGYKPTPTIVQAAEILYRTHSVIEISRSDSGAKNLQETSASVSAVIDRARRSPAKAICFVTGVPGSGKTLAGLNIATRRSVEHLDEHAVFLSGNGPLVDVLREALTRDKAAREGVSKKEAEREVRSFIQNIHHFRDEYVGNDTIPLEKVVVFDEAQRAWTRKQAASFMQRKRGQHDFNMSEPEFLISVMDRHREWCTIVCLVGGGQEINTGEAGISEWINALEARFPSWEVYISSRMALPEYGSLNQVEQFLKSPRVHSDEHLHLAVSMRSFRAEALSEFIGHIIDNESEAARDTYKTIDRVYPIYLTRDLAAAKAWLRGQARGTERFGLVASSGAQRLRPEGIYVKAKLEPVNWFLNDRADVRSSYYLEDVASEFAVQGLELDWVGACWDGDFHHKDGMWTYQSFEGTKWQSMNDESRRLYLKNAYRVILTRARQGMVLFVPKGDTSDRTRLPYFYDGTFEFLRLCGISTLT
jgi:plasmid stability protein